MTLPANSCIYCTRRVRWDDRLDRWVHVHSGLTHCMFKRPTTKENGNAEER